MEKSTVINYVCEHAVVQETISKNVYSVRFPNPHSAKLFTANDPESLVDKICDYVETNDGRKIIDKHDFTAYTDEFYDSSDGDEE